MVNSGWELNIQPKTEIVFVVGGIKFTHHYTEFLPWLLKSKRIIYLNHSWRKYLDRYRRRMVSINSFSSVHNCIMAHWISYLTVRCSYLINFLPFFIFINVFLIVKKSLSINFGFFVEIYTKSYMVEQIQIGHEIIIFNQILKIRCSKRNRTTRLYEFHCI